MEKRLHAAPASVLFFKLVVPCNLFASVSAKHALNTSTDPVTCFKANCNMNSASSSIGLLE